MKKSYLLFFAFIFTLLIAGCVAKDEKPVNAKSDTKAIVHKNTKSKTSESFNIVGNSTGNVMNGGIAGQEGPYIYYSDSKTLYRAEAKDPEQKTELDSGKGIDSINIVGGIVYYSKESSLWKISSDGTGKEKLFSLKDRYRLTVYKDKAIYLEQKPTEETSKLVISDLHGENQVNINDFVSDYSITDNKLYFVDAIERDHNVARDALYYVDLDGELKENFVTYSPKLESIIAEGEYLYFYDAGKLFKMKNNNAERRNLTPDEEKGDYDILPNKVDNKLIYPIDQNLFMKDSDGKGPGELIAAAVYEYSVAGNHLFYWKIHEGKNYVEIVDLATVQTTATNQGENNSTEGTESGIPMGGFDALFEIYDRVAASGELRSIREIEEEEDTLDPENSYFPQEHIVGATKRLLFAFSTRDLELFKTLLTDPDINTYPMWDESKDLQVQGDPSGGFYEFQIQVTSDNSVYVVRDTPGHDANFSVDFEKIDGKYYVKKIY